MMMKVFVYGTLRKGEGNARLLDGATCLAEQCWTDGALFDTGYGYPAMKQSQLDRVYGELYAVSDADLKRLDHLEGYIPGGTNNLYERIEQTVYTDKGSFTAFVYVASNSSLVKKHILSGDWKLYQFENSHSKIVYFAYGSCMDDVRFKKQNVHHYFQNVIGSGKLHGYTLRFTRKALDGGRADIVEEGGVVEGKLYDITADALDYLYGREGVKAGCYRPAFIEVEYNGLLLKNVLTFTVVDKEAETAPPDHYMQEIIRGGTGYVSEQYLMVLQTYVKETLMTNQGGR
ncbi:gamma-glutamylcyclotransferase [Bacillus sp. HMF5848]|uniref:gamma-glutamylcyclotransferase n=1 Tax=Bacillus sp. HMF5848 TaxID=2495421 RepID=UPI000F7A3CA9|nr:gamma-glutamylcyclotransferase family protein [Bacillus sp. HMF5848]RSK27625.1 gamma-glutamylcyclotransferase [Bacillus sp. HMF5848]